jgi:hypothetical protein
MFEVARPRIGEFSHRYKEKGGGQQRVTADGDLSPQIGKTQPRSMYGYPPLVLTRQGRPTSVHANDGRRFFAPLVPKGYRCACTTWPIRGSGFLDDLPDGKQDNGRPRALDLRARSGPSCPGSEGVGARRLDAEPRPNLLRLRANRPLGQPRQGR